VHLTGNVSTMGSEVIVNASTQLGYSSYGQRVLVGGHLAAAKVFAVEFELATYDDLMLERTFDASTGLPLWNRIGGAALAEMSGSEPLGATPRKAEPGAVSARAEAEPAEEDEDEAQEQDEEDDEAVGVANVHVAQTKREPQVIRRRGAAKSEPTEAEEPAQSETEASEAPSSDETPRPAGKNEWQAAIDKAQTEKEAPSGGLNIPEGSEAKSTSKGDELRPDLDDFDDDLYVEKGDILIHPTLGEVEVARVVDDQSAYIRVGRTRPRKFALHMFELEREGERDGVRVFRLSKKKRRRGRSR